MVDLGQLYSWIVQFKDFKEGYSIPCTDKSRPVGPVSEAPVLLHDILEQLELRLSASLMDEPADGVTQPRGTFVPNKTLPRREAALARNTCNSLLNRVYQVTGWNCLSKLQLCQHITFQTPPRRRSTAAPRPCLLWRDYRCVRAETGGYKGTPGRRDRHVERDGGGE